MTSVISTDTQFREILREWKESEQTMRDMQPKYQAVVKNTKRLKDLLQDYMEKAGIRRVSVGPFVMEKSVSKWMPPMNIDTMKSAWEHKGLDVDSLFDELSVYRKTHKREADKWKVKTV